MSYVEDHEVFFYLGEVRKIKLEVRDVSATPQEFMIENARAYFDSNPIPCVLNDETLTVTVAPECTGKHDLEYRYDIADETFIERVSVIVR